MRTAIIVSVVAVAIMLVVAVGAWALATTEFGFFGAETRRSSTDRNTRQEAPMPDISEVGATAVASETTHASPGPGAELVGLITKPRGPVFFELGERIQLEVFGIYSDGASYPLPEDAQIVYASSQPEFVSIDPYEMMTATRNGGAEITATYGGFSARAPAAIFLPMQEIPPFDPELVYFTDDDGSAVILNRIIVHTENEYQRATSDRIATRHDATVIAEFANMDAFLMETETSTMEDLEATLDQLSNDPDVDEAFPDGFIPPAQGPSPETAQMVTSKTPRPVAAYAEVKLPGAWAVLNALPSHTFSHVNIAVLDTGMYSHKCNVDFTNATNIKDIMEHEFPSSGQSGDPLSPVLIHEESCSDKLDHIAHGISVVSILAAANNSAPGPGGERFSGVLASVPNLPYHVLVYDIRAVIFKLGKLEVELKPVSEVIKDKLKKELLPENVRDQLQKSEFYSALNNITGSKIKVLNISAGCVKTGSRCMENFREAVDKFASKSPHTLIVLSAGNGNADRKKWDNIPPNVVVVGGTEGKSCPGFVSYQRHYQSNYGEDIAISAPYCVYTIAAKKSHSYAQKTGYTVSGGTSLSAPLVSGTAALLFAIAPKLSPKEVTGILDRTADAIVNCTLDCAGWKSLNAHAAVCETLYGLGSKNDATPCPAPQPTPTPLLPWMRSGQTRMAQPTPTPLLPWMRSGQTRMAQPTPTTPQPAPTQTVAACVPGSIGDTGVRVAEQSFFETKALGSPGFQSEPATADQFFESLISGPVFGLGMEEDFYADNNLAWLVWMLRFEVPEDAGEVDLSIRWVRVLRGGELSVMSAGAGESLVGGGVEVLISSVSGITDAPSVWLPGQYFVDAWSTQHDCAVAEWYFEVH